MTRDFTYQLRQILKAAPVDHPGDFDGRIFRFDFNSQEDENGSILTVVSHTTVNLNGLKIFRATSIFHIPFEQPAPGAVQNHILTELIYQHLCRETDMIFNVSQGQIILQPPTQKSILDTLNAEDN